MNAMDLISIVLPVYNGERFLRESIDSVLDQTYTNWELLILDDCSTDSTPEICKEYAEKDERIHYHRNEKNLKLPGNLNAGFRLAKGDFLTWTSDDNRFMPKALEVMHAKLKENPQSDLVYATYYVMDEDGNKTAEMPARHCSKNTVLSTNVVGACFMYTRKIYTIVGDYDVDLFLVEDWDYWQRVIMNCNVEIIEEPLYWYRQHGGTLTSTKKLEGFGRAIETMLKKNRPMFGKLSHAEKQAYHDCMYQSRKYQKKFNIYAPGYHWRKLARRVKGIFFSSH